MARGRTPGDDTRTCLRDAGELLPDEARTVGFRAGRTSTIWIYQRWPRSMRRLGVKDGTVGEIVLSGHSTQTRTPARSSVRTFADQPIEARP